MRASIPSAGASLGTMVARYWLRLLAASLILLIIAAPKSSSLAQSTAEAGAKWNCDDEELNKLAVQSLHEKLDDDNDGEVELKETSEFVMNEFSASESNGRYKKFHANDTNISLSEMRTKWTTGNAAHNWSTAQLVYWLEEAVRMPEYSAAFTKFNVQGNCLPRIALNKEKFLQDVFGITKREDRRRLKLKAMEAVLFGPIFPSHFWYHVGLAFISIVAMVMGAFMLRTRQQNLDMARMLEESHNRLKEAQTIQESLSKEREISADEVSTAGGDVAASVIEDSIQDDIIIQAENMESQISELRQHVVFLKRQLESRESNTVHVDLLKLLCQTYERETGYFDATKETAEKSLKESEEAYMKFVRKVKNSIIPSSIKLGGGRSLTELDQSISNAKSRLANVVADRQERQLRWSHIEKLCRFKVTGPSAMRKLSQAAAVSSHDAAVSSPSMHASSRGTAGAKRLSRTGTKAATFSGTTTAMDLEDRPGAVKRSVSSQDSPAPPYRPSGGGSSATSSAGSSVLSSTASSSSLQLAAAAKARSLSPSKRTTSSAQMSTSESAHSLRRMQEIDESDDQSPSPQRRKLHIRNSTGGGSADNWRRRSDEVDVRQPSSTKPGGRSQAPVRPKGTKRLLSDPGDNAALPRGAFTIGGSNSLGDAEAPESEV